MDKTIQAVGKRKTAIARVYMTSGSGKIIINDRTVADYFPRATSQMYIQQPFGLTNNVDKFDIKVNVIGGGSSAQAQATKHGISKALLTYDETLRPVLKKAGFLTRDSREVERKKYGKSGARKRYQYSKR
jgi:small subunit ribosomal protein S9